MTIVDVNMVMLVVWILTAGLGFGVWISPKALDWCVARMYARACALAAARRAYGDAWVSAMEKKR